MLPIPAKIKMWLGLVLVVVVAGGQYLLKVDPAVTGVVNPLVMIALWLEGLFTTTPADAKSLASSEKRVTDLTAKLGGMSVLLLALGAGIFGVSGMGCKGAKFPGLDTVEQVVLSDLMECGTTPACVTQMETDVTTLIAQGLLGPDAGTDAVVLVKDALMFLIDTGVIPADILPKAKACLRAERLSLSIRGAE